MHVRSKRWTMSTFAAILLAVVAVSAPPAQASHLGAAERSSIGISGVRLGDSRVRVPAKANPWALVGLQADGTAPVVVRLGVPRPTFLTFPSITGQWDFGNTAVESADGTPITPDRNCGGLRCRLVSRGRLSGIADYQRFWYLAGIFIGRKLPNRAPRSRNFTSNHNFHLLHVKLGQAFFIGDGRTSGGQLQRFEVPAGASRLVLGMPDICHPGGPPDCYFDNSGTISVRMRVHGEHRHHRFPIYHVVRRGEWIWKIARDFLHRYYGTAPAGHLVAIESRIIYRLNRRKLPNGPGILHVGTRLLIARGPSDIPKPT